ncbi:MAG: hypothetical protein DRJ31_03595 [Candidatus Methanomethylicota archaeon]|uniref:Uncharacterized protein n=1 Tax=Thermoproteota archaeon TaxID=2056631 RepID=A0A497ERG8_9CREN|nr:MAG: hypothetical protein DRJ31_03595 [Candidatus Verstraetearchaeota archaeon]RLE53490.1 MAG: hypothetical protein DRJ33_00930 [Candidatus Verstraetearchaeota archaeon]
MALRAALMILSFVLALGPIVYGLYLYNWNVYEYVTPTFPEGIGLGGLPSISIGGVEAEHFGAGAFELTLYLVVDNQMDTQLTVSNVTFDLYCSEHNVKLGSAYMESSVEVPAGQTANVPVKMVGTFDGFTHVVSYHSYTYTDPVTNQTVYVVSFPANIKNGVLKLSFYQVELQSSFEYANVPISFEFGGE